MDSNVDIVFFGDSLTFGYGVPKESSWVYKTAHKLNLNYVNKGKNGDTTSAMLARYNRDVLSYKPSNIFIMGGTNDLLCGRNVSSIAENIELMIKDAIELNVHIILGTPPKIIGSMANELFSPSSFYSYAEENLPKLRECLISLSKKYNTDLIDFFNIKFDPELYIDGLHLSSDGNFIMYKEALKILN